MLDGSANAARGRTQGMIESWNSPTTGHSVDADYSPHVTCRSTAIARATRSLDTQTRGALAAADEKRSPFASGKIWSTRALETDTSREG